jgi:cytoskeletal protein RodZ
MLKYLALLTLALALTPLQRHLTSRVYLLQDSESTETSTDTNSTATASNSTESASNSTEATSNSTESASNSTEADSSATNTSTSTSSADTTESDDYSELETDDYSYLVRFTQEYQYAYSSMGSDSIVSAQVDEDELSYYSFLERRLQY